jgi:hypothetical protein
MMSLSGSVAATVWAAAQVGVTAHINVASNNTRIAAS